MNTKMKSFSAYAMHVWEKISSVSSTAILYLLSICEWVKCNPFTATVQIVQHITVIAALVCAWDHKVMFAITFCGLYAFFSVIQFLGWPRILDNHEEEPEEEGDAASSSEEIQVM